MVASTHAAAIKASDKVTLQGVTARTPESAQSFASEHGVETYADVAAIAADPAIDFAIIVTPPNARIELIEPLAKAGKPILLEKPVARDYKEAEQVVTLCEDAGVKLGIVFQHRMREASKKATELIASGALGVLGVVEINVPWWREQAYYDEPGRGTYARDGGGVLISQAIHTLDLALSLTGPVASVQAMTATSRFHTMEAEDFATAGLRFTNGAIGSLVASSASFPGDAETITLHFDKASLHLGSGVLTVSWRKGETETFGASATTGGGADPMAFTHEWHQGIIEDFCDAITDGRDPVVTGRSALASHALIGAITQSSNDARAVMVTS
ncbi:MAG: Gfo/Idh/MocA family oxidoreductase [Rhizobiales bacterium]|nr:Gfo/Idh/MocA family oxidoreductase [Hyphomicrobiales bacterium]MBO6699613.1 Gfo/Idh/MocA family oxidoreductase [Hyphomicrobiales bacterium]MBO6737151.1 Gfo/Idh/MocA family oxidoreductase [Hyphomicrobiales bacterium]MBO6911775.1 Gfo/Idh/MocA family oxidoreductase [Hyphomicrobiales bacterium]MBO6954712.1 Gfo/Idh/MocA family oxidoreductase [Hyphomicrobiales bacterium]